MQNAEIIPLTPQLNRELYPDLSTDEIMVKSLSNLLLRGFSSDEVKRFEFFLDERLSNKIDAATFETMLDRPYHEEGVGLWKQRALKISAITEDIIAERKKLVDVLHELEKNPEKSLTTEVSELRAWMLKEYSGHVDDLQRMRLDDAVSKRLRGAMTAEEFHKTLNLAHSKGGVGFSIRSAQRLSDRLESVLVSGLPGDIKEAITNVANV